MKEVKDPRIHKIIDDLKNKYGLKEQDFFSACLCIVNFLEYYYEEGMIDVMYSCPEKYAGCDSNNRRACAGALKAEQKSEGISTEEQFAYYVGRVQEDIALLDENDPREGRIWPELEERLSTCYRREVILPFIIGADIDSFPDVDLSKEYNKSNLTVWKTLDGILQESINKFKEEEKKKREKLIEDSKSNPSFSVLVASPIDVSFLASEFDKVNREFYLDRNFQTAVFNSGQLVVIQSGEKSLVDLQERIEKPIRRSILVMGNKDHHFNTVPIEDGFKSGVPDALKKYNITHIIFHSIK